MYSEFVTHGSYVLLRCHKYWIGEDCAIGPGGTQGWAPMSFRAEHFHQPINAYICFMCVSV